MSGVIDPMRLKVPTQLAHYDFWIEHITAAFDLLKTTTAFCLFLFISLYVLMGGTNRWTLISNFTQLRNNFKVEQPEGWKQSEKEKKKLKE